MLKFSEKFRKLSEGEKKKFIQVLKQSGEDYNVYPLSSEQERMWFLYQMDKNNPYYNVTFGIHIKGELDKEIFKKAWEHLVQRNKVFTTTLIFVEGEAFQVVNEPEEAFIDELDLSLKEEKEALLKEVFQKEYQKPFDLEEEFPIRVKLVKMGEKEHIFILNIHHMFCDGWSMGLIIQELNEVYQQIASGHKLSLEKEVQYWDYALYSKHLNQEENISYWKEQLKNANICTSLLNNSPKPVKDAGKGVFVSQVAGDKKKILSFCRNQNISVFSLFIGVYSLVLWSFSGENNLTIGTPVLNRNDEKWSQVMGFFSNTIPVNIKFNENMTYDEYLKQVHNTVLNAIDHSELPFDELVNCLNIKREQNSNPVFQSVFTLQNDTLFHGNSDAFLNMKLMNADKEPNLQFDFMCSITEKEEEYQLEMAGRETMYQKEWIQVLTRRYCEILENILENAKEQIGVFEYDKAEERSISEKKIQAEDALEQVVLENQKEIKDCKVLIEGNRCYLFYEADKELEFSNLLKVIEEEYVMTLLVCKVEDAAGLEKRKMRSETASFSKKICTLQNQIRKKNGVEGFYLNLVNKSMEMEGYDIGVINPKELQEKKEHKEEKLQKKPDETALADLSILDGGSPVIYTDRTLLDALMNLEPDQRKEQIVCIGHDGGITTFTYEELQVKAKNIAANLMSKELGENPNIILIINNVCDFIPVFWGCILAGVTVTPLGTPKSFNPDEAAGRRILDVIQVSKPAYMIVGDVEAEPVKELALPDDFVLSYQEVQKENGCPYIRPDIKETDVCLLMFTSGSTGGPKGVPLQHGNVMARSHAFIDHYHLQKWDRTLNWMPMDHVGGVLMFHICGVINHTFQVQADTEHILKKPIRWLMYLDQYKITSTWAPNFAYGLILDYQEEVLKTDFSLKTVKYIINAGEAINYNACHEFMELLSLKELAKNAMIPCWGMTETSSGVLYSECFGEIIYKNSVAVGKPVKGVRVRIVDNDKKLVPKGKIGELEISGVTTHMGYYKRDQLNAEVFSADGWFDTGDQAVILKDEIVITGRSKELIIKNGLNTSCLEVEKCIEEIDCIQTGTVGCSVLKDEETNQDEICIFFGDPEGVSKELVKEKISFQMMKNYGFTYDYLVAVPLEDIPRTSIGKIDKKKLVVMLHENRLHSIDTNDANRIPEWFYQVKEVEKEVKQNKQKESRISIKTYCRKEENLIYNRMKDTLKGRKEFAFVQGNTGQKEDAVIINITDCTPDTCMQSFENEIKMFCKILDEMNGEGNLMVIAEQDNPVRTLIEGFCCSIPQEYPQVKIRIITYVEDGERTDDSLHFTDDANTGMFAQFAEEIMEFVNFSKKVSYVQYQNGKRQIRQMEPMDLRQHEISRDSFQKNGTYVVIGGTGGIGRHLCKYLLERYDCRLILIGRRSEEECLALLEQLRKYGEVEYTSCQIREQGDLLRILSKYADKNLTGIIDLIGEESTTVHVSHAGEYGIEKLAEKNVMELALPRMAAVADINEFVKDKEGLDIILFNSVTAFFGGQTYSIYSSVSRYMYEYPWSSPKNQYFNYAWSKWDNMGMSKGETLNDRIIAQNAGYAIMDLKKGFASLEGLLKRNITHALIGVDCIHTALYSYGEVDIKDIALEKRTVQVVCQSKEKILIEDNVCEIRYVNNQKDEKESEQNGLTPMEEKMKGIWEGVLKRQDISVTDGFFQMGGTSIKVVTLLDRIQTAFDIEISIIDLFTHPSIRELVRYIKPEEKNENQCKIITI
ncbi:SDR family NAD(P)-dependent oxidoreductase [[Clostridium] polysaccharolyticum]|uniref:Acyl-CoA synthetase (AMP-forming)/AMP-acid ligase II n=1 Tax=[Clostridium] polysaccharolyticum TaxID=29364 RepID=A0A1I0AEJ9_9FIRM|nr:SDR family NAD(P)-dependent oxidoreductase [[Clostridium] polysaccharolyticum]SES92591.1 Acyl-CoA synthetase (AMP-forming)/AMP-acid ligase II [[Clostridium] polysaccharolyticum]